MAPTQPQLRVVAIGGGTGLSTLLRGLKHYVQPMQGTRASDARSSDAHCEGLSCRISHLSALVTVTDDGGSSGRLREDLNMLPPGDVRNCVAALSEDERLLTQLFQYRFPGGDGTGLAGHSFGNLFLAALTAIHGGDFAKAVQMSSQILAARGHIYPATNSNVTLSARMDDGSVVHGETNITASKHSIVELLLEPRDAKPLPQTLEAIAKADLITLGPGSLFTSLITNLLVDGIPQAIAASKATRVYLCNLMTQANESLGLTASQHIERIQAHCGGVRLFDYAIINTAPISPALLSKYASEGQEPIRADLARIQSLGVTPVTGNFVHEGDVLRHDYDRVASVLLDLPLRTQATV
ncbi:MAG: gluconeogenesis factor YvcK family protein [Janthinobacterium lividum]